MASEANKEMEVSKQETVMFSKGRCCFVRFECSGTSDRALLSEKDAVELVRRWVSYPRIKADRDALLEALKVVLGLAEIKYGNLHADVNAEFEKARAAIVAAEKV